MTDKSKMDKDYDHILNIDYDHEFSEGDIGSNTFITSKGRNTEKLDGIWSYTIDTFDTGIRKRYFDEVDEDENGRKIPVDFSFEDWDKVELPSNWNFYKPELLYYEGSVIFTRKFNHIKKSGKRTFLKIGAANYETRIWLNKKYLGKHYGGFTPFCYEITNDLEADNRIYIQVNNTRKLENIPSINFDWFNYGGIYRSIEIIEVPETFVKNYSISLKPDNCYNTISACIALDSLKKISNSSARLTIPELAIETTIPIIDSFGKIEIKSDKIELWSPESPKLYDVEIHYNNEVIKDKIGFRQIEVEGTHIYLNGNDVFLKGVCAHEEIYNKGRYLSENEMTHVIKTAKEMNCNYMRLAHYPHSERMAELADEYGLMLWEEIPVYWALEFDNHKTQKMAESQLKEMIFRDLNRASVIIWGVGNENPDTDSRLNFMKGLADTANMIDPTRLTGAACLVNIDHYKIEDRLSKYIDVVGINEYYGWYYRDYDILKKICEKSNIGKPVLVSETGAGAVAGHHGTKNDLFTEELQADVYENQFKILKTADYVRGITPWILFDFRSQVRLNGFQKGFNRKGLIAEDRITKKKAFYIVQKYYSNN